jgi:hypothetical protein
MLVTPPAARPGGAGSRYTSTTRVHSCGDARVYHKGPSSKLATGEAVAPMSVYAVGGFPDTFTALAKEDIDKQLGLWQTLSHKCSARRTCEGQPVTTSPIALYKNHLSQTVCCTDKDHQPAASAAAAAADVGVAAAGSAPVMCFFSCSLSAAAAARPVPPLSPGAVPAAAEAATEQNSTVQYRQQRWPKAWSGSRKGACK